KKHGHKAYYTDGAYLVVGNHHSMLDVVPTAMSSYRPLHFIAKQEIWNVKAGAWFCNKSDAFPVARDGSDVKAMMKAMKLLREGEMVAIYPEGTRNTTGEIFRRPLMSGSASLAIKTKTPIIFHIQLSRMKAFRRHHVYYSEPYYMSQYYGRKLTPEVIAEADSVILEKMYEYYFILDEEVNGRKNRKKEAKELKKLAKQQAKDERQTAKTKAKATD
ncbi:MAG: 1-acyl-sn-glycerol-3-phosphate acyltransferase, partial [Clostridia bacterium]|nr:1-acyl-sn-glycerol-3-phosphate acyltransferase [Clostridia bacterium]